MRLLTLLSQTLLLFTSTKYRRAPVEAVILEKPWPVMRGSTVCRLTSYVNHFSEKIGANTSTHRIQPVLKAMCSSPQFPSIAVLFCPKR